VVPIKFGVVRQAVPGQVHLAHAANFSEPQLVCQADPIHHITTVGELHKETEFLACNSENTKFSARLIAPSYGNIALGEVS
jgi:hypothetical protein